MNLSMFGSVVEAPAAGGAAGYCTGVSGRTPVLVKGATTVGAVAGGTAGEGFDLRFGATTKG
jgi:hypothetical protein